MPDVLIVWLAGSRACGGTAALPGLRPPDWLDGAAGTLGGVEGCRVAGASAGGGSATAAESQIEAGLGRPGGARCAGPAASQAVADGPAGDPGHAAGLAPAAGPLAVGLSAPGRQAAGQRQGRGADRADGAGEPGLGIQADPGRAARPRVSGRGLHGAAGAEAAADTARAAPLPVHVAAVPARPCLDDARVRFLSMSTAR
jgi:hypothetical protein